MRVPPPIQRINKANIAALAKSAKEGYKTGCRTADINGEKHLKRAITVTKGTCRGVKNYATIDDIPLLTATVSLFIPVPFIQPVATALSFVVYGVLKAGKSVVEKK